MSSDDRVALALELELEVWFGRVLGPGSKKRQRGNANGLWLVGLVRSAAIR